MCLWSPPSGIDALTLHWNKLAMLPLIEMHREMAMVAPERSRKTELSFPRSLIDMNRAQSPPFVQSLIS